MKIYVKPQIGEQIVVLTTIVAQSETTLEFSKDDASTNYDILSKDRGYNSDDNWQVME